jgi:hypothetical protein
MTKDTWESAILGAVLGSIVIPGVFVIIDKIKKYWQNSRPAKKLLQGIVDNNERVKIFVRDFLITQGTSLYSIEPRLGIGTVPNVQELWPDVEGRAIGNLLNMFGQVGKTKNTEIVRMSQDHIGEWNCNLIVLGAQTQKSYDFYKNMQKVAYRMDGTEIYDNTTNEIIPREASYGYGIILKTRNPLKPKGQGIAFLIGGFGVLGTAAASYYFKENFQKLGKEFGEKYFGIIVRTSVSAGEQATERLKKYDKVFNS